MRVLKFFFLFFLGSIAIEIARFANAEILVPENGRDLMTKSLDPDECLLRIVFNIRAILELICRLNDDLSRASLNEIEIFFLASDCNRNLKESNGIPN